MIFWSNSFSILGKTAESNFFSWIMRRRWRMIVANDIQKWIFICRKEPYDRSMHNNNVFLLFFQNFKRQHKGFVTTNAARGMSVHSFVQYFNQINIREWLDSLSMQTFQLFSPYKSEWLPIRSNDVFSKTQFFLLKNSNKRPCRLNSRVLRSCHCTSHKLASTLSVVFGRRSVTFSVCRL